LGKTSTVSEWLQRIKDEVRPVWRDAIVSLYPADSGNYLKREGDSFTNPVGQNIRDTVDQVIEAIVDGADDARMTACLLPMARIRAVQGGTAAEGVAFVFVLKRLLTECLKRGAGVEESDDRVALAEELDSLMDRMLALGFNAFDSCRGAIHDLKHDELKRNVYLLLKQANMVDVQGGGE
jgi:hypothetical protein